MMLSMFVFLLFLGMSLRSVTSKQTDDLLDTPENWCKYIKSTPEPSIIFYNRIPKCGSSSMENLFRSMKDKNSMTSWSAGSEYWTDFSRDVTERKKFLDEVASRTRPNATLVIDGHWGQYDFSSSELLKVKAEYIQLARDCISRRQSAFLYGLYDSRDATLHRKNPSQYEKYKQKYLNTTLASMDCIKSYDCLKNSDTFGNANTEMQYLCGSRCTHVHHGNRTVGALHNIHSTRHFAVIGILEELEKFLEMLECAYPRSLTGILKQYRTTKTHANTGSHDFLNPAISKMLSERCSIEETPFGMIYDEIKKQFYSRYAFMSRNWNSCCRSL